MWYCYMVDHVDQGFIVDVLQCIAKISIALHRIGLHCIVSYCIVLNCSVEQLQELVSRAG